MKGFKVPYPANQSNVFRYFIHLSILFVTVRIISLMKSIALLLQNNRPPLLLPRKSPDCQESSRPHKEVVMDMHSPDHDLALHHRSGQAAGAEQDPDLRFGHCRNQQALPSPGKLRKIKTYVHHQKGSFQQDPLDIS